MIEIEDFYEFSPNQLFAEYLKFYVSLEYKVNNGRFPQKAFNIINNEVTPSAAQEACYVIDDFNQKNENRDQLGSFIRHFLLYFKNLSDDNNNEDEEEWVFLRHKHQTITYGQIEEAYLCYINNPAVKIAAEMGIDMFYSDFGAKDIINNERYDLGIDIVNTISFSDNTELYKKAIFEAARKNEETLIPTLVNIVIHAYETVKEIRSNEMHDDDEEDYVYEPLFLQQLGDENEDHGENADHVYEPLDDENEEIQEDHDHLLWKKHRPQKEEIDSDDEDLVM